MPTDPALSANVLNGAPARHLARAPMRPQDSLRLRLPVLIAALITVILAAFLWASHREVESAMVRTGGERAQVAADQLAALLAQSIARTVADMRRTADDETIRRYLSTPAEAERPIVAQRLRSLATAGQPPVVLVNAAGHRIVEVAGPPGTGTSPALPPPVDVPSHLGVAPFQVTDGVVFTDIVAEVVDGPSEPATDSAARRLGFLIVRRTMAAAQASEMIGRLIGAGARVAVGNRLNEVWTNLSTLVPAPLVDLERRGMASYAAAEGAQWVGALAPIEGTPWAAWIEFPQDAVLAPARDLMDRLVWLASGFDAAARDVTALKHAEQALHDRMTELADINRELEPFSYSVSHDLRAPLRHITGFSALLERAAGSRLQQSDRRCLHTITDAADRMGRLIDELLAFSRMGRTVVTKQRVALGSIVESARQELAPQTAGREIQWNIPPLPDVEADPTMLRLAIVNLLSNAIKYTSTRARAHIEVATTHDETGDLVVFVRDNGVGFDMQYVGKLFGVFQRLHRSDEFDGTGIGLANVRRIVHRHGGRVWAEGVLDHGATFFFSLPGRGSQT